ncbi:MAG TPA: histone deacetylase [Tepidisphaeraceae bacterium]|jgi:acetoin utilization deacetylase AcuC-like enzyme
MVGLCLSREFLRHRVTPGHPERPERILAIEQAITDAGLMQKMMLINPKPADEGTLQTIHSSQYIQSVRQICEAGGGMLDADTPVARESFGIAQLSTGALLSVCDAVMSGQIRRGFSAARPPGHHALPDSAMGFCLFANIAIAAKYLQNQYNLERIAIVDFDVHHGNGTQACFESDPSVLFISVHQDPRTLWPGSGFGEETGTGAGQGFTLNIPLMPGADDAVYLRTINEQVIPRVEEFQPQILLLSAGFDAHQDDPLAQMCVTTEGFGEITRQLCDLANRCCGGKVISALEGGYNLHALGQSVVQHLIALGEM